MAQAKQTHKAVIGECDAGLMKIAVPIFSNGNFLGTAGGCGLLPQGGEVETFMIERTAGLSAEEIAALCEGMNSMTQGQAGEMADFIEERIAEYKTQKFINDWVDDTLCIKTIFISLFQDLLQKEEVRNRISRATRNQLFIAGGSQKAKRPAAFCHDRHH
jgi:hypothetical protein